MKVITISLPPLMTNCYIVYEREAGKCFIIDPASDENRITSFINSMKLKPKAVLLTHGHFDHIGAADSLRDKYSIPLYIHNDDNEMIMSPTVNCSSLFMGTPLSLKTADKLLKDGDKIKLENDVITVMHTPGHSKGSCVFVCGDIAFTGDTLFKDGYGRYDLYGGDFDVLMESLRKVLQLPQTVKVYPGHGEETTIYEEQMHY